MEQKAPCNIWFAEISCKEDGSRRRIRVSSLNETYGLRMAKRFCIPGEKVITLFDKNMKIVWQGS